MHDRHVILVSHGFQSHYELGFANGLANNGIQVTLLGLNNTLRDKLHAGINFINIRGSQAPERSTWRKLRNLLVYHARLLHYVAGHRQATVMVIGLVYPELFVGVLEGLALRLLASKFSFTVHNILPHDKHTAWMRIIYWVIYRIPHLLIVHTPATTASLQEQFGLDTGKVIIVEHGSNDAVELSQLTRGQAKVSFGFLPEDVVLLFFGAISPYKGLDLLLDALNDHPAVKLLVGGRCPGNDYGKLMRERLTTLEKDGRVRWIDGYLDEAGVSTLFAAADAVVLPYRHIDQSGVLLLALTLGVPMIATNVGDFRAFINQDTGLIVNGSSSAALSQGIADFLLIHPRYNEKTIRALGRKCNWENTVKTLLSRI